MQIRLANQTNESHAKHTHTQSRRCFFCGQKAPLEVLLLSSSLLLFDGAAWLLSLLVVLLSSSSFGWYCFLPLPCGCCRSFVCTEIQKVKSKSLTRIINRPQSEIMQSDVALSAVVVPPLLVVGDVFFPLGWLLLSPHFFWVVVVPSFTCWAVLLWVVLPLRLQK